jgi:hypothetical protein
MLIDFIPSKFPAGDVTDGQYLYRSLGSFWTQIFRDKNVLKGYTIGTADELIQSYFNLTEAIKQYSVKDIDILHKEKWLPLVIKKSEFNNAPFKFTSNSAVFGKQPNTDSFYAGQIFRFGFSKETGGQVYSFTPTVALSKFGAIANRIIAPSLVLIPGIDVVMQEGTLYFTVNLFNNSRIPTAKVIDDFGSPVTFKDSRGEVFEEEFIVLWMHMAEIDQAALYNTFGVLLDLNLPSAESYKEILKAVFNLYVEGPTVRALTSAFAALAKAPVIIEPEEIVDDIYVDDYNQYVITDKNVYKLALNQNISSDVARGVIFFSGEILSADVSVSDSVIDPIWWQSKVQTTKLSFASHIFIAGVKNQLFFENSLKLLTYTGAAPNPQDKKLIFPVLGRDTDVQLFQDYINLPENKNELISLLKFKPNITSSITINPIDFLFKNLFKNNTLFVKLDFYEQTQLELFVSLLPLLQFHLPSHVYLLLYISITLPQDTLSRLNSGLKIHAFPGRLFSFDGSEYLTGSRPILGNDDPDYYKDYLNRLFCISLGPYRNGQPLHADGTAKFNNVNNLDDLQLNHPIGVTAGTMRTDIPASVQPPGEPFPRLPSTREIQSILLIDF